MKVVDSVALIILGRSNQKLYMRSCTVYILFRVNYSGLKRI